MQNTIKETLKNNGLKITGARLSILETFLKSKVPLDAEMVYKKINNTNEVTVYRTLASLEEGGVLKRVDLRKESVYFELAAKHHHHIVCTNCDRVEDFKNKQIEKVLERIVENSSKFKSIKEHSLELFGLCRMCT